MSRPVRFHLAGILLFLGISALAQDRPADDGAGKWNGSIDLTSGYGLGRGGTGTFSDLNAALHHFWEQGGVRLSYTSPRLSFTTSLKGKYERNTIQISRVTAQGEDDVALNSRIELFQRPEAGWDARLRWHPSARQHFEWDAMYDMNLLQKGNSSARISVSDINQEAEVVSSRYFIEEMQQLQHTASAGFLYSWFLPSTRYSLHSSIRWKSRFDAKNSVWEQGDLDSNGDQLHPYFYRLTPALNNHELSGAVFWRDSTLAGVPNLFLETGIRVLSRLTDDDKKGEVSVDKDHWRDSTSLTENYHFLEFQIDPGIKLDYRLGKTFRAGSDYTFRLYLRRLRSLGNPREPMQPLRPGLLGRSFVEWKPTGMHTFTVGTSVNFKEPPYTQLSTYLRQGNETHQLIRGNPDLMSMRSVSVDVQYLFRWKGFSTLSVTQYEYRNREVERTFYDEEIDGQNYRIFTWLNTANGQTFSQKLRFAWNYKWVGLFAEAVYKQTRQKALTADTVQKNRHWEATAGLDVRPGKGWLVTSRVHYRGDVKTFYSLLKSYCNLNVRVEKRFNRWTLYAEGRDLLDKPVEVTFYSQDLTHSWYEQQRLNRRLFLLGGSWNF